MAHEISLEEVTERAHQVEIICRMMESYPDRMADSEIVALATLLRRLSGSVVSFLIEEQAVKVKK